eukprot:7006420-Prymnesium_polylepis.1
MRHNGFDIAILDEHYDLNGGVLRGADVTRAWRQVEQERPASADPLRRMVIVGCTGNAGDGNRDDLALAAGQDMIWSKPLPPPRRR